LLGICGEYPTNNLSIIIPSAAYGRKLVADLVKNGIIKLAYKDKLRGYRLKNKGKKLLLEKHPDRFDLYLATKSETNHPPSDPSRRKRLMSQAEVLALMHMSGVAIFPDVKPDVFGAKSTPLADESHPAPVGEIMESPGESRLGSGIPSHIPQPHIPISPFQPPHPNNTPSILPFPSFYTSREYKRGDGTKGDGKPEVVRGSRGAGILMTPTTVYNVYNTGDSITKWAPEVEYKWRIEVESTVSRKLMFDQYRGADVGGILMGKSMELLEHYIREMFKQQSMLSFFMQTYDPFYFITNDEYGKTQLELLCNPKAMYDLHAMMGAKLKPRNKTHPVEHDALTGDNIPILFLPLLNIPRLVRFRSGLGMGMDNGISKGMVFGFDFQQEVIERWLRAEGADVEFKCINITKVRGRFLC